MLIKKNQINLSNTQNKEVIFSFFLFKLTFVISLTLSLSLTFYLFSLRISLFCKFKQRKMFTSGCSFSFSFFAPKSSLRRAICLKFVQIAVCKRVFVDLFYIDFRFLLQFLRWKWNEIELKKRKVKMIEKQKWKRRTPIEAKKKQNQIVFQNLNWKLENKQNQIFLLLSLSLESWLFTFEKEGKMIKKNVLNIRKIFQKTK